MAEQTTFQDTLTTVNTKTNISEIAQCNYDATFFNTKTARDMALTSHNLSPDGTYARCADGSLWIWSDRRNWIRIDKETK